MTDRLPLEPENLQLVELVSGIAARKDATPAQLALAWLLSRKPWIVPIPSTTRPERLRENVRATDVDLTAADLHEISKALPNIEVQGARYSAGAQRLIDR